MERQDPMVQALRKRLCEGCELRELSDKELGRLMLKDEIRMLRRCDGPITVRTNIKGFEDRAMCRKRTALGKN